jgi:hypothetical protein
VNVSLASPSTSTTAGASTTTIPTYGINSTSYSPGGPVHYHVPPNWNHHPIPHAAHVQSPNISTTFGSTTMFGQGPPGTTGSHTTFQAPGPMYIVNSVGPVGQQPFTPPPGGIKLANNLNKPAGSKVSIGGMIWTVAEDGMTLTNPSHPIAPNMFGQHLAHVAPPGKISSAGTEGKPVIPYSSLTPPMASGSQVQAPSAETTVSNGPFSSNSVASKANVVVSSLSQKTNLKSVLGYHGQSYLVDDLQPTDFPLDPLKLPIHVKTKFSQTFVNLAKSSAWHPSQYSPRLSPESLWQLLDLTPADIDHVDQMMEKQHGLMLAGFPDHLMAFEDYPFDPMDDDMGGDTDQSEDDDMYPVHMDLVDMGMGAHTEMLVSGTAHAAAAASTRRSPPTTGFDELVKKLAGLLAKVPQGNMTKMELQSGYEAHVFANEEKLIQAEKDKVAKMQAMYEKHAAANPHLQQQQHAYHKYLTPSQQFKVTQQILQVQDEAKKAAKAVLEASTDVSGKKDGKAKPFVSSGKKENEHKKPDE